MNTTKYGNASARTTDAPPFQFSVVRLRQKYICGASSWQTLGMRMESTHVSRGESADKRERQVRRQSEAPTRFDFCSWRVGETGELNRTRTAFPTPFQAQDSHPKKSKRCRASLATALGHSQNSPSANRSAKTGKSRRLPLRTAPVLSFARQPCAPNCAKLASNACVFLQNRLKTR